MFWLPYCLTEIEKSSESERDEQTLTAKGDEIEELKAKPIKTKLAQEPSSKKCPHHLGYLSQRSRAEKTSEKCMLCEKLIECILKNHS